MVAEGLLQILAGMALMFLSQSRIQGSLDELVFHRLRARITRLFQSQASLWLIGLGSSLFLQVNRIPISMGSKLVERRVISPEQAFILVLGATVGNSLKSWFFAAQLQIQFALAFLFSGIVCSLFRNTRLQLLSMPLIAAGCFWAALELIWQGFEPFVDSLSQLSALGWLDGTHLLAQIWLTLLGILLLVGLRSGTLPLFLLLQLCWSGLLKLEAGSALILGLNIGMGLFPFQRQAAKATVSQFYWAHLLNRAIIGGVMLVFFPYFMQLSLLLVPGPASPSFTAFRVAIFHILCNGLMAAGGLFLMGLFFRAAQWIVPGEHLPSALILSRNVRRMLQRSPAHALHEVENQLQIALEHTKQLTDQTLRLLTEKGVVTDEKASESYLFETVEHSIYDLLLPLYQNGAEELRLPIHQALRVLDACGQLFDQTQQLMLELSQGFQIQLYSLPEHLIPAFENYQTEINELWLAVLLKRPHYRGPEALEATLESLEERFFDIQAPEQAKGDRLIWVYRILSLLRQQSLLLYQVFHAQHNA